MTPSTILASAIEEAGHVLARLLPGEITAQQALDLLIPILDNEEVVKAMREVKAPAR